MKIIITCEHATNNIPDAYLKAFANEKMRLATHEGYDIGALSVAELLAKKAGFSQYGKASRLLIDLNRSLDNPELFSDISQKFDEATQEEITKKYYMLYRVAVIEKIQAWILSGENILHLSVHSFTPKLHNKTRAAEIGFLYDPAKIVEKNFCEKWRQKIQIKQPDWRLRMNYPYRGTSDGFCTFLRKKFPKKYSGIELEINQALLKSEKDILSVAKCVEETFYLTVEA